MSTLRVRLEPDDSMTLDSFCIVDAGADEIRIEAQSMSGLMAGGGKFLCGSRFDLGWFTLGAWCWCFITEVSRARNLLRHTWRQQV